MSQLISVEKSEYDAFLTRYGFRLRRFENSEGEEFYDGSRLAACRTPREFCIVSELTSPKPAKPFPMLTKFLAAYTKSGLRGNYRANHFLASRIEDLQRLPVKTVYGLLVVDLRVGSGQGLAFRPFEETGEADVMRRFIRPTDAAYDIGAHFGIFTALMASLAKEVVAFDANAAVYKCLAETAQFYDNVRPFNLALSDKKETLEFYIPEQATMASLYNWTSGHAGKVRVETVNAVRLDDFIAENDLPFPDFIKCDVEGAEMKVFAGAEKIFDSERPPVVLFEVIRDVMNAFGTPAAECASIFTRRGYKFFEVKPESLREIENLDLKYANVVAVPPHRL